MKKIMFVLVLATVFAAACDRLFADAVAIVDWKWDDATERRYTVNSATPGTLNLQLGSSLTTTAYDPAWVTVDGRKCADFSNQSVGLTYGKASSSWTSALYATLAPSTYTIEMIFALQTVPVVGDWTSNYPPSLLTLVDTTNAAVVYQVRCTGTSINYITAGGTISVDTAGTAYEIAANDWLYLSVTYDGAEAVMTVYNMTKDKYGQVASETVGSLGVWTTGDAGAIAVGAEVTTTGTYRRSIDGLIDEVKISSGVVDEADRLVIVPEPATMTILAIGGICLFRKRRNA